MFSEKCCHLFELNKRLKPNSEQIRTLYQLTEHMTTVGQSLNLTAIKEPEDIILKHYIDSLTVSSLIPENAKVLDVGCGAGFPTFPLAIFRRDIEITALDSTAKRTKYVHETAELLHLNHVHVVTARAEEYAQNSCFREQFDIVTARAVASLSILAELCLPLCRIGGFFIAMKAKQAEEELYKAQNAIQTCGGKVLQCSDINLISNQQTTDARVLITIQKFFSSPKNFPRHFSKISKKPL